jgi:hypothetical protein
MAMPQCPDSGCPDRDELWLPFGATLGAAFHPGVEEGVPGFFLGGEASLVYARDEGEKGFYPDVTLWVGGYVDGLYDFGNEVGRLSFGPEIGYRYVGVDGGPLIQFDDGDVFAGGQVRLVGGVGVVASFVRLGFIPEDERIHRILEVGFLLKFPALLDEW